MRHHSSTIFLLALLAAGTLQAQTLSVSLTASEYNGYHISCFGLKDGNIEATVSGGTPPYMYRWSTKDTTIAISGVPAGYYAIAVMDADSTVVLADITLTEPMALKVAAEPYEYPSGYNVSCPECFNGSIDVTVHHGVPPYSYHWNDGVQTEDRSGLGALKYGVKVIDANGCETKSETVYMTQPGRDSWDMGGNADTDPGTHYLGTTDTASLVLKSNGAELLRLTGAGEVKLLGSGQEAGLVYRLPNGTLRGGGGPVYPPLPPSLCYLLDARPFWETRGNDFSELCPEETPLLGTLSEMPLNIVTNGQQRAIVTTTGEVGIGTLTPDADLHIQGDLLVRDGSYGDIVTSSSASTGPVLWARNNLAAWGLSIGPDGKGHILGDWNNPHPVMNFCYDQVEVPHQLLIGDVEARPGYRLFVQDGMLAEKVKVAIKSSSEWSDHVFQPSYRLMPLKDVSAFIKKNGHLPGVPSAEQMVEQGLDVVKTDAMLLEKIEEITLHLIETNLRLDALEKENEILRSRIIAEQ